MFNFFETHKKSFLIAFSLAFISGGAYNVVPMWQSLPILFGLWILISILYNSFDSKKIEESLISEIETRTKELVEVEDILTEYNSILDSLLVQLPCVCGGNTFEGIFSPNTENIVECEKCKNKYRVYVSYNSVLISEPMDINQTFDQLIKNKQ